MHMIEVYMCVYIYMYRERGGAALSSSAASKSNTRWKTASILSYYITSYYIILLNIMCIINYVKYYVLLNTMLNIMYC